MKNQSKQSELSVNRIPNNPLIDYDFSEYEFMESIMRETETDIKILQSTTEITRLIILALSQPEKPIFTIRDFICFCKKFNPDFTDELIIHSVKRVGLVNINRNMESKNISDDGVFYAVALRLQCLGVFPSADDLVSI